MSYLSVGETARKLNVSSQRVYQLIELEQLHADRVGKTWLIDEASVDSRVRAQPKAGRPQKNQATTLRRYTLMNRTHEVLSFNYDQASGIFLDTTEIHDPARAPLGMLSPRGASTSGAALQSWWSHRAIPASRTGIDVKLQQLGIADPAEIPFRSLGFSLSDQYWLRTADNPELTWEDLNFFTNDFTPFDPAADWLSDVGLNSPDNTSEGMLPKRWICGQHGQRTLLKGGGPHNQEPYNEVIASALHRRLLSSAEFVPYRLEHYGKQVVSACDCFISDTEEYIPAFSVLGTLRKAAHHNDFQHYIECCAKLGLTGTDTVLSKMIITDNILANTDRHLRNFGLIRNVDTLEYRFAPLFDTGSSLWANVTTATLLKGDYSFATKPFKENPTYQLLLADDFSWLKTSALEGFIDEAEAILRESELERSRVDAVLVGLQARIERMQRIME